MNAFAPTESGLASHLVALGPADSIPATDRIYDFLIGSWDLEVIDWLPDGTRRLGSGECHAAWVLEGTAIQDVWICPRLSERTAFDLRPGNRCGTTLRLYDPSERAWHVAWFNPASGAENRLIGRRVGDDVVQTGRDSGGNLIRWSFSDITANSAEWTGEVSTDQGATWFVQCSFSLRRRS